MSSQNLPEIKLPDPVEVSKHMANVAEQSQRIIVQFLDPAKLGEHHHAFLDPTRVGRMFGDFLQAMMKDPMKVVDAQMRLWSDYMALWGHAFRRALGQESEPVIEPHAGDKRFKHEEWEHNPAFDYIKQSYLLAARYIFDVVDNTEGLDDRTAKKIEFYTRQFVDALAPTNFAITNPEVLRQTMETGGENLLKGLRNLLDDLEKGKGRLKVKMTDIDQFELGANVATTPGKVVYQNELMQLLQYDSTTDEVYQRPLLIFPPWINKYYILDLREKNSFIKWAVDEGHTVFVMSWVNPDETLAEKTFDDYLSEGPLAALEAIEQASGEREVKAIGYCLGGTLLAATLAYLKAKGEDRIKAATYFTTMVDFAEPGELEVFLDEEELEMVERLMEAKGYLDGAHMAQVFNLLRANDLIWSFVVNNYLMGNDPFPFDLLYWNSDSTRMPRAMHSFYLRNMYQNNRLIEPGGISMNGVPIDVRSIETPSYLISTKEDHISPWKSTYAATQLYSGPVKFVLGMSGHIAGVVNPPAKNKYGYWTNEALPKDPETWLAGAEEHQGSWWPDWAKWVGQYNGPMVPARVPGDGRLDVIEDAPGSYVKVRIS